MEANFASCTKPLRASPDRFRVTFKAPGASKTSALLKEFDDSHFFVVAAPSAFSLLRKALRRAPQSSKMQPPDALEGAPAAPRSFPPTHLERSAASPEPLEPSKKHIRSHLTLQSHLRRLHKASRSFSGPISAYFRGSRRLKNQRFT